MLTNLTKHMFLDQYENDFKRDFEVHDKYRIRFYSTASMGLAESLRGFEKLFPHKKKVLIVTGGSSLLLSAIEYLTGEAYEIKTFSWVETEEIKTFVSKEKSNLSYCLFSEDDGFTGEIFPYSELLAHISKERVYSIRLSGISSRLADRVSEHDGFHIRISSQSEDLAIGFMGSRSKKLQKLDLTDHAQVRAVMSLKSSSQEICKLSSDFQFSDPRAQKIVFASMSLDRVCFYVSGMDGFAIKELLVEKTKCDPELISSASLCEWGPSKDLSYLKDSYEKFYELVTVHSSIVEAIDTSLKEVIDELEAISKG
ncbi:MAG: hypothetical protein AB8E15_06730 [Bdellovibrionales bacterium]